MLLNSNNTIDSRYNFASFGSVMYAWVNTDVTYKFTGQERDDETALYNFRARLYDAELGMFYAYDPAAQGFSPFGYANNNPVIYIDKDGRWIWLAVAAVVGAAINVASNWDDINNVGDFFSYAGVGAGSGLLATLGPLGWAGAGALTGSGNTLLQRGNIGDIAFNGLIGGVSGLAGGYAASWASANLGGAIVNGFNLNANSAITGFISGGIGGGAGAFGGGFTAGLITTGDFGTALQMGINVIPMGLGIGGTVGFSANVSQNISSGRNWFSGRPNQSVVLGEDMINRVNPAAKDIRSSTIDPEWREKFGNNRVPQDVAREFNRVWLQQKMDQGYYIYNYGPAGEFAARPLYLLELNMFSNYNRVYNLNSWLLNDHWKIYYYK